MEPIQSTRYQLNPKIVDDIEPYLNDCELRKLPMPQEGRTANNIRILESHKIVIRIATTTQERDNLAMRLDKMILAKEIISKNQFKQLKVPKATLKDHYMIEKLLPCVGGALLSTMAYYVQNHHFFDSAVSEFTELLLETTLEDIVGYNRWMRKEFKYRLPRYDNIKIYETCKDGKNKYRIGLIDLEHFKPIQKDGNYVLKAARDAIYLFPFQFDLILSICKKRKDFDAVDIMMLENCKVNALKSITNSTTAHVNFILEKRSLFSEFLSSEEAQASLIKELLQLTLKESEDNPANLYYVHTKSVVYLKMLGETPADMLPYCEQNILTPLLKKMIRLMKPILEKTKNDSPNKDYLMMSKRVISFQMRPRKNLLRYKDKLDVEHTFLVNDLGRPVVNKPLPYPVDSDICKEIVKNELAMGQYNLFFKQTMADLFKEKGFIAQAFHDEEHTTIFF